MVYNTERAEMAALMWHQPRQRCRYTTSVDIQKVTRYEKKGKKRKKKIFFFFTHVESHASAVSQFESGEQR